MTKKPSKNGHIKLEERLPTAYFLSLEIENVRCFGLRQSLDLSDGKGKPAPWTIILGVNGTGKTTLLQCLAGFELTYDVQATKEMDYDPVIYLSGSSGTYGNTLIRSGLPNKISQLISKYSVSFKLTDVPISLLEFHVQLEELTTGCKGINLAKIDQLPLFAYGAGRRIGSIAFIEPSPDDKPTRSLFSDRAELRNPEEWLLYLDYTASTQSNVQEQQRFRRDQAVDLLKQVLWEIQGIRPIPGAGVRPKPRVEFKTPYGWVPFRQLGYGYQSLATWVADFASRMVERYPESKNPLEEPAVVLVDEIDLHLHPKWQRELMGRLTKLFPNTQFIATAHSPLIAQAAANANLAVLRREGDHVVIDNDVDYIRNWRVDQILTSDLFGLDSARPPHVAKLIAERDAILGKSKLTKADEKELKRLEDEIGELPVGETKQQREEMDQVRKSLDALLKKEGLNLE